MNIGLLMSITLVLIGVIITLVCINKENENETEIEGEKFKKSNYIPFEANKVYNTNWEFLDKVIYINLDERVDRRMEMMEVLSVIPENKIVRLLAIKYSPGNIGCTMSHIKALKLAIKNNWKNVLILEDDAGWNNYEQGYNKLVSLLKRYPNYDVITLGNTFSQFDKSSARIFRGQTTSGYLVNGHYFKKLLSNFEEGLKLLLETSLCINYCIDVYWNKLMKVDNWYIVNPALVVQRPSKSNIEGTMVDYIDIFNLEPFEVNVNELLK